MSFSLTRFLATLLFVVVTFVEVCVIAQSYQVCDSATMETGQCPILDQIFTRHQAPKRKPVIIDTDVGSFADDFYGIALLLTDPSIDVLYILTSGGDTAAKTKILAKFLANCGVAHHIPIGQGPATPEHEYLAADAEGLLMPWKETDRDDNKYSNPILKKWAINYDLKHYPGGYNSDGIAKAVEIIESFQPSEDMEALTYVVKGTSENVLEMIETDSELFRRNKVQIVAMGGTITPDASEYNFLIAPQSARAMLSASDNVLIAPVETCFKARLHLSTDEDHYGTILKGSSRIILALSQLELALANYGTHKEVASGRTDILFDSVAAFLVTGRHSDLYTLEQLQCEVTDKGYLQPSSSAFSTSIKVMKWRDNVDENVGKFKDYFVDTIASGRIAI